jgi:hypothetical protein
MSLFDYKRSKEIGHYPFYALLMAAFREADSYNFEKLCEAFPEVHVEMQMRYDAPGGLLVGERDIGLGFTRTAAGLEDDYGNLIREC